MSKFLKPGSFKEVDVNGVDILNEDNQLPGQYEGRSFTNGDSFLNSMSVSWNDPFEFCDTYRFTAWHWLHNQMHVKQTG